MSAISITPLAPGLSFGNRVDGVTWDNIEDEELRAQLRQLFIERGVLVFENMEPSPKMQVALSQVFGPVSCLFGEGAGEGNRLLAFEFDGQKLIDRSIVLEAT